MAGPSRGSNPPCSGKEFQPWSSWIHATNASAPAKIAAAHCAGVACGAVFSSVYRGRNARRSSVTEASRIAHQAGDVPPEMDCAATNAMKIANGAAR
jgi:hypothetical protein